MDQDQGERRVRVERVLAPVEIGADQFVALKAKLARNKEASVALDGWHAEAKIQYEAEMAAAIADADVKKTTLVVPKDATLETYTVLYQLPDKRSVVDQKVV